MLRGSEKTFMHACRKDTEIGAGERLVVIVLRLAIDDSQVHVFVGPNKGEGHGLVGRGGPVLDGEDELPAVTVQRQSGIDPGEEVARASQILAAATTAVLARVVDDADGEVVCALQFAQIAEDGGNI